MFFWMFEKNRHFFLDVKSGIKTVLDIFCFNGFVLF